MREIKFRAWADGKMWYPDKQREDWWFFGSEGFWSLNDGARIKCVLCDNLESDRAALMQYTDLQDKSGTEIYEGDILKCSRLDMEYSDIVAVKYTPGQFVVYNPNCCDVCKSGDGCIEYLSDRVSFSQQWDIEVIGNVHENPELLK